MLFLGGLDACHIRQLGADGDGDRDAGTCACSCSFTGDRDRVARTRAGADDRGGAICGQWSCVVPVAVGKYQLQPVHPRRRHLCPLRGCRAFLDDSTAAELPYELG